MTAMSINRPRTPPRTPPTRAPVSECCVDCVDALFPALGTTTIVVETSGSNHVVDVRTGIVFVVCVVFVTSGRSAWTPRLGTLRLRTMRYQGDALCKAKVRAASRLN